MAYHKYVLLNSILVHPYCLAHHISLFCFCVTYPILSSQFVVPFPSDFNFLIPPLSIPIPMCACIYIYILHMRKHVPAASCNDPQFQSSLQLPLHSLQLKHIPTATCTFSSSICWWASRLIP